MRDERRVVSLKENLAVLGAAALVALSAAAPEAAQAGVVLKKAETKKVFQAAPAQRAPKGPKQPKEKKEGSGFAALSAPSVGVPTIGSGPLASLPFVFGSVGLLAGAAVLAIRVDDGFMEFIDEAMSKDVSTYVGNETDLK